MKFTNGVGLGFALALGLLTTQPGQASPFSSVADVRVASGAPVVDVASRRHVRRNQAVTAGALIGAAIVGGALIAGSQRQSPYGYDDGYYYGGTQDYYAPVQYYPNPQQYPPALFNQGGEAGRPPQGFFDGGRPYYGPGYRTGPSYREYPRYREYRSYQPGPRYYRDDSYYYPQPRRGRAVRDPAGGGTMR